MERIRTASTGLGSLRAWPRRAKDAHTSTAPAPPASRAQRRSTTRKPMRASPARRTQRLAPSGLSATMPMMAGSNAPEREPPMRKLARTGMARAEATAAMMAPAAASRRIARADRSSSCERPSNASALPAATSDARPAPVLTRIETAVMPSRSSKDGGPEVATAALRTRTCSSSGVRLPPERAIARHGCRPTAVPGSLPGGSRAPSRHSASGEPRRRRNRSDRAW